MTDGTRGLTVPLVLRLLGAQSPDYQGFISCPSPEHPDRHPSCHVTKDQRGWACFACGAKGGVLDLIVNLGFAADRKEAASWLEQVAV
jgi:CHC2-type zinc finger protein